MKPDIRRFVLLFSAMKLLVFFCSGLYLIAYPLWVIPWIVSAGSLDPLLPYDAVLTGALGTVLVFYSLKLYWAVIKSVSSSS